MSTFKINCDTFVRLVKICSFFSPSTPDEIKEKLNVLRLENVGGYCIAVVTNEKIAAVELLGNTDQKDGVAHLKLSKELVEQCKKESLYGSELTVTTIPEIAISTLQTSLGFTQSDCCKWFDSTPMDKWRQWGVDNPTSSTGAMYWNLEHIEILFQSSPSGRIIFPEFIDAKKPVTLRDYMNEKWVGLFIPQPPEGEVVMREAVLPEWWDV